MTVTYESLLGNSVEFFSDSIESYKNQKYKNAVSSLWTGVLLLLKCKLYKIHPVLIYKDILNFLKIDDGNLIFSSINSVKDLQTVTLNDIERRFKQFKIKCDVYKRYQGNLSKIQNARNQAEHCVCVLSENDLLNFYENAIPFVNDFMEEELNTDPTEVFENWTDFLSIEEVANARKKNVEEFIDEHTDIESVKNGTHISAECPVCGSEAIDIGDKMLTCKNCGNKEPYHICSECSGVFPENGFTTFYEDLGLCYDCFAEKSGINDSD